MCRRCAIPVHPASIEATGTNLMTLTETREELEDGWIMNVQSI